MPKLFAKILFSLLVALATSTLSFCVDPVVIHVDEPTSDAGNLDALLPEADAPDDVATRPCETCMRAPSLPGPGCGDVVAACAPDPACAGTFECALAKGCLELSGQGLIVDCGLPCARDAGLDPTGPSANLVFAVVTCAQETCGPICRGEAEGGL